jgi:hypothetical protein
MPPPEQSMVHRLFGQSRVQMLPDLHVPLQVAFSSQLMGHVASPALQSMVQVARSVQSIAQVEPFPHVILQTLLLEQATEQVPFVHVKLQFSSSLHTHREPHARGGVVVAPVSTAPLSITRGGGSEVAGVAGVPDPEELDPSGASVVLPLPIVQSREHPPLASAPAITSATNAMLTRRRIRAA